MLAHVHQEGVRPLAFAADGEVGEDNLRANVAVNVTVNVTVREECNGLFRRRR